MTAPKLSFGESDNDQRIEEFNAAARNVFDTNLTTEVELFGRLQDDGFMIADGLNNIPAILLARLSPMICAALQLAGIHPESDEREAIHDLVRSILEQPNMYEISRKPQTQASILNGVQSELNLRTAAMEIEPLVAQECGTVAGEILLPPVVGNEPLLSTLRETTPDAVLVKQIVIITIRYIVLEGRLPFYEIIRMSR